MNDRHGQIFKEQLKLIHARKMCMGIIINDEELKKAVFFENNKLDEMKNKYGYRLEVIYHGYQGSSI